MGYNGLIQWDIHCITINVGKTTSETTYLTGNGKFIPPLKIVMTGDGANGIVLPTFDCL